MAKSAKVETAVGARVLMPLTDAFGGHGGIALYNRDVIRALDRCERIASVIGLPRIVGEHAETLPSTLDWRAGAAGSLRSFAKEAARAALRDRPIDMIWCAHSNLLGISAAVKAVTGAKLVLATYGFEAWDPFPRSIDRAGLKMVDGVMAISRFTARRLSAWSGIDESDIELLPNAIERAPYGPGLKSAELAERYGLASRKVVMLFGRMHPTERRKGFDQMIEALPEIREKEPAAALFFCGDGDDRPRLEAKARELGVKEHVKFSGRVDEAEKADHYRLADAYVMPSTQEGFGFVHLEAMACGVPVVASSADGAFDAVRGGELGLLVDPADRSDIVAKTLAALARPRGVPDGLSYFDAAQFDRRLCDFVGRILG